MTTWFPPSFALLVLVLPLVPVVAVDADDKDIARLVKQTKATPLPWPAWRSSPTANASPPPATTAPRASGGHRADLAPARDLPIFN